MKLRVHRDTLLYGVQRVQAVAERRTSLQILSSFLLEAKDATSARISATNLQIGLEMVMPAEVKEGGVVAVGRERSSRSSGTSLRVRSSWISTSSTGCM